MLKLLIILAILFFLGARFLPRAGSWLGEQARKPFRLAKWSWNWLDGDDENAVQAEIDYGLECARELVREFPGQPSAASQAFIAQTGARLHKAASASPYTFRFQVLHVDTPNAFALPGGFVFISEGLLRLCRHDEPQVAFVLAHEMAHITCGHVKARILADAALSWSTSRLSGSGPLLRELLSKGYARQQEFEADRVGKQFLVAAGFDPFAAERLMKRLEHATGNSGQRDEYFSTHPSFPDRIANLGRPRNAQAP